MRGLFRERCVDTLLLKLPKKGHKTITGNTNTRNSNTKTLSNMCKLLGQWNIGENGPKNVWMALLRGSARCQSRGHFRNMSWERVENPGKNNQLVLRSPWTEDYGRASFHQVALNESYKPAPMIRERNNQFVLWRAQTEEHGTPSFFPIVPNESHKAAPSR